RGRSAVGSCFPPHFAWCVSRSIRAETRSALGLAEFCSLRSSVDDRDLIVPRSGEVILARAVRELARSLAERSALQSREDGFRRIEGVRIRPAGGKGFRLRNTSALPPCPSAD